MKWILPYAPLWVGFFFFFFCAPIILSSSFSYKMPSIEPVAMGSVFLTGPWLGPMESRTPIIVISLLWLTMIMSRQLVYRSSSPRKSLRTSHLPALLRSQWQCPKFGIPFCFLPIRSSCSSQNSCRSSEVYGCRKQKLLFSQACKIWEFIASHNVLRLKNPEFSTSMMPSETQTHSRLSLPQSLSSGCLW